MDPRTSTVITFMQANLQRKLPLTRIAHRVNISPSRLRHMFKDEIGITPTQYLRMLRIQQAKGLLETTFLRVKEISNLVGMGYDVSLVRDFKRAYGMTPAKYRCHFLKHISMSQD